MPHVRINDSLQNERTVIQMICKVFFFFLHNTPNRSPIHTPAAKGANELPSGLNTFKQQPVKHYERTHAHIQKKLELLKSCRNF